MASSSLLGRSSSGETMAVLSIATAGLLGYLDSKKDKQPIEELLDASPMRFALCYAIVQELDRYSKN